jgi:hypothetical protein
MADEGLEIRLSDLLSRGDIYREWGNQGRPLYSIFTIKDRHLILVTGDRIEITTLPRFDEIKR